MPRPAPPLSIGTLLLLSIGLAACAPRQETRSWRGPVTPTDPGPLCKESRGLLQVTGDALMFLPDEGTWLLSGKLSPDGHIDITRTASGADKKPYVTQLTAILAGNEVTGTYTTPRCRFTVRLSAV